jgi:hypothetical protein
MITKIKIMYQALQAEPIALPLFVDHIGMCPAGDQIEDFRDGLQ